MRLLTIKQFTLVCWMILAPAVASAQWQKRMVCGNSCAGDCGPCPGSSARTIVQPRRTEPPPLSDIPQAPGPNLQLNFRQWEPQDGYDFTHNDRDDTDFEVSWVPGRLSRRWANVVASDDERVWKPAPGYRWVNEDNDRDHRVEWVPGMPHPDYENAIATSSEGEFEPEDGFVWKNAARAIRDYQTTENHLIEDAISAASWVETVELTRSKLEELSGLKFYSKVEFVLKEFAIDWLIKMPEVADRVAREQALQFAQDEVKGLLKQTLGNIVSLMLADIKELAPYRWNPFAAEKRALVARMEREIENLRVQATSEFDRLDSLTAIRSGRTKSALKYNPGPAIGQLLEINTRRRWAD